MNPSLTTEFPDRLLTLCDGRPGLRGTLHVEISSPSSAELHSAVSQSSALPATNPPPAAHPLPSDGRGIKGEGQSSPSSELLAPCSGAVLDFISSDETLDRYDEIIMASGWRLENYRRNPVFQNSHQYGDILFTLGKALITEIRTRPSSLSSLPSPYLFQRIEFAVDANPMARIAYGLYLPGFLTSLSVGFFPIRWQNADDSPGAAPSPFRRKYLEQELLEVSAVAIPANPNALALALKSGSVEKSDLRETLDLLRSICGSSGPISPISPIGPIGPIPPLQPTLADYLPLARTLRDLLRR
jgi:Caudovirus prohead serine protease